MISFKQFLLEGIVQVYHRTWPETAARLQAGEKLQPGGLSVFVDPERAEKYNAETSHGTIPDDAVTVSGKTSSRNLIPDFEWHPDAYKPLFVKVAQGIEQDPNFRVPTLTTAVAPPAKKAGTHDIPGLRVDVDPETGKKVLRRNWEPKFRIVGGERQNLGPFSLKDFPMEFKDGPQTTPAQKITIDDPRVKPVIDYKSSVLMGDRSSAGSGRFGEAWGGKATHGMQTYVDPFSGEKVSANNPFRETRHLDVLGRKGDITDITNRALKAAPKDPSNFIHGFRTRPGRPVDMSGAEQAKQIAVKGADVLGKVTSVLDPLSAAGEFVAGRIAPIAGGVASMYGLADTIFGKEAKADAPMMEPEKKEQEEKDDLLSAAMNPGDKPVAKGAAVELKRAEFRRNQEKLMSAK